MENEKEKYFREISTKDLTIFYGSVKISANIEKMVLHGGNFMFIKDYGDFLKKEGLSETTIRIYSGRLRRLLENGYSEAD